MPFNVMYTPLYVTVTPFDHLLANYMLGENGKAAGNSEAGASSASSA